MYQKELFLEVKDTFSHLLLLDAGMKLLGLYKVSIFSELFWKELVYNSISLNFECSISLKVLVVFNVNVLLHSKKKKKICFSILIVLNKIYINKIYYFNNF